MALEYTDINNLKAFYNKDSFLYVLVRNKQRFVFVVEYCT